MVHWSPDILVGRIFTPNQIQADDWLVGWVLLDLVFVLTVISLPSFTGAMIFPQKVALINADTKMTYLGKCNDYLKKLEGSGIVFIMGDGL